MFGMVTYVCHIFISPLHNLYCCLYNNNYFSPALYISKKSTRYGVLTGFFLEREKRWAWNKSIWESRVIRGATHITNEKCVCGV